MVVSAKRRPSLDFDTYRAITESVPAMLWLGDVTGKCVFLNRAQREFWGVDESAIATFDWSATVHPDDMDALARPYMAAMETREPFETEARFRRADGTWRMLRTNASPRFDYDGTFLGMTGVNVDVTDQRKAEEALRRSGEQLRHALDASRGVGTFVWDVAENLVRSDRSFALAHGLDPDASERGLPPEDYVNAILEDDVPRARELMAEILETGGEFENEYRVGDVAGGERWLHCRGSCDKRDGEIARVSGVVLDITERKQQEQRLALMTRELAHRIKNVFAVVRALTATAARETPEARGALDKLGARFDALAAAYLNTTPGDDEFVGSSTRLHALAETLFAPYSEGGRNRIDVTGPDLALAPQAASSLALIFHELATNAAKYGALSRHGTVQLSVVACDGDVHFDWRENGGDGAVAEPKAAGFGTRLVAVSAQNIDGEVAADWHAGGLHWRMRVPETSLTGG